MINWKEQYLVPDMDSVHVKDGYENVCENCEKWGSACERCNVSVPLVADRMVVKEREMAVMTICGIPVGTPYEVGS